MSNSFKNELNLEYTDMKSSQRSQHLSKWSHWDKIGTSLSGHLRKETPNNWLCTDADSSAPGSHLSGNKDDSPGKSGQAQISAKEHKQNEWKVTPQDIHGCSFASNELNSTKAKSNVHHFSNDVKIFGVRCLVGAKQTVGQGSPNSRRVTEVEVEREQ